MKWLKFNDITHVGSWRFERYAIDWELEEQKYKEPLSGVRVYETGRVEIRCAGWRNPDWRGRFHSLTGLEFLSPKRDFPCAKFTTPEGRPVLKSDIAAKLVLYDSSRQRVYPLNRWSDKITLYSPHAQPVCSSDGIVVRPVNKARYAETCERLQPYVDLGQTLVQLGRDAAYLYPHVLKQRTTNPPSISSEKGRDFAIQLARRPDREKLLKRFTRDKDLHPFLLVKE